VTHESRKATSEEGKNDPTHKCQKTKLHPYGRVTAARFFTRRITALPGLEAVRLYLRSTSLAHQAGLKRANSQKMPPV